MPTDDDPRPGFNWPNLLYLRPMLRRYLSSAVRGFEWYVTRSEAVPRDHFGQHPWFSNREGAGRSR